MFNRLIFPNVPPSYGVGKLTGEIIHVPRKKAQPPPSSSSNQQQQQQNSTTSAAAAATSSSSSSSTSPEDLILNKLKEGLPATSSSVSPLTHRLWPTHVDFTCGLLLRGSAECEHIVVYAHPNAVDVGIMRQEFVLMSRRCNVHCFLIEFQGYGLLKSASPSEQQAIDDTLAGYRFVRDILRFPSKKIIGVGRSIGTGALTSVCADYLQSPEETPLHLVLQCPFSSIKACVKSLAGDKFGDFASELVGERFETIKNILNVKCPVTVIHGTEDKIVPYVQGKAIVEAAKKGGKSDVEMITLNCDHNDIPMEPGFKLIREVIASAKQQQQQQQNSSSSSETTLPIERYIPYLVGPCVQTEIYQGRSRPFPLDRDSFHLAQTLTYNSFSFLSLVRASWELYEMCLEEANSVHKSGTETMLQYVNMFASPLVGVSFTGSIAEQWKKSDFIELCACLYGSPFSVGVLANNKNSSSASQGEEEKAAAAEEQQQKESSSSSSSSARFLVFGTSVPSSDVETAFDSKEETSHYDELWSRMQHLLRHTFREVSETLFKIQREEVEMKQRAQKAIEAKKKQQQQQQQQQKEGEKVPLKMGGDEEESEGDNKQLVVAGKNASAETPPLNTAAIIASSEKKRTENFVPVLWWQMSKTILKVFSDNLEKSSRTAMETMRRVEETYHQTGTAYKPQPVTQSGSQWVQIEVERFILSHLVCNFDNKTKNKNEGIEAQKRETYPQEVIVEAMVNSSHQQSDDVAAWKVKLFELLNSPMIKGTLVPLPVTTEASDALKELLKHFRNAPSDLCVPAPSLLSEVAKKNQAADCVIA